ncbi:MAG TPA: hypothetical protein VNJ02_04790 [Vicinamibacterales bacterium]|nr:hypothetical protein [Vicinamibacterales bacterium]
MSLLEALARIGGAVAFFYLPGLLLVRVARIRLDALELIAAAFAASFALLTILNVPLFVFGLNLTALVWFWAALAVALALVAWRVGTPDATTAEPPSPPWHGWLLVTCLVALAGLSVALAAKGALLGGEEEVELIITRKLLESDALIFNQINYLKGLPATYLLVPLQLMRALISAVSGVDPVLAHYRLAFVGPLIVLSGLYGLLVTLGADRGMARAALLATAGWVLFGSLATTKPPFLFTVAETPLFFRGVAVIQLVYVVWLAAALRACAETQDRRAVFTAAAAVLFFAAMFTHGVNAAYDLIVLALIAAPALTVALRGGSAGWRRPDVRAAWLLLLLSVAGVVAYKLAFDAFMPGGEAGAVRARAEIGQAFTGLFNGWRAALLDLPPPATFYEYFNVRGTSFAHIDSLFVRRLTPIATVAMLAAPALWLISADRGRTALAATLVVIPVIARVPFLLLAVVFVNASLFTNAYYHLLIQAFVALILVAIAVGGMAGAAINRVASQRLRSCLAIVAVAAACLFAWWGGVAADPVAQWTRGHRDEALAIFFAWAITALVGGVLLRERIRSVANLSSPSAVATAITAALLSTLLVATDGPGTSVIQAGLDKLSTPEGNDEYGAYTENLIGLHERQTRFPRELFAALMFIRASIPEGSTFDADPDVIRAIPLMTNQYVVHSGVPFDFVERYFATYYTPTEAGPAAYQALDPLFRADRSLDYEATRLAAGMMETFNVDYVLVTPRFHDYTPQLVRRAAVSRGWKSAAVYDSGGFALLAITR